MYEPSARSEGRQVVGEKERETEDSCSLPLLQGEKREQNEKKKEPISSAQATLFDDCCSHSAASVLNAPSLLKKRKKARHYESRRIESRFRSSRLETPFVAQLVYMSAEVLLMRTPFFS